jgi:colanic acid/amylovoran biosynthesis glycosyltransferase
MRVLVTGASGFLGRHVVAALRKRGHSVRALYYPADDSFKSDKNLEVIVADLLETNLVEKKVFADVDAVIHLAMKMTGSGDEMLRQAVEGTRRLLDAVSQSACRRVVLASSFSVYDWSRVKRTLHEGSPILNEKSVQEADGYARAKLRQELLTREMCERSGLQLTVLRPASIWGGGRMPMAVMGQPAGPITFLVAPLATIKFTSVENCAEMFVRSLERPEAVGQTSQHRRQRPRDGLPRLQRTSEATVRRRQSSTRALPVWPDTRRRRSCHRALIDLRVPRQASALPGILRAYANSRLGSSRWLAITTGCADLLALGFAGSCLNARSNGLTLTSVRTAISRMLATPERSSMSAKLTIGYLTNIYARASDTFIRGEVLQLRALGHTVHTFSIRKAPEDSHISEEIRQEQSTTDYILNHSKLRLVQSMVMWCIRSPMRVLSTLILARQTCPPGLRSMVWQAAYLLEASYLAQQIRRLGIQHLHNHIATGVGTVAMLAAHLADIPYSMTVHGFPEFFEMDKWALPEKIRRSAFISCITEFCRSQCMAWTSPDVWHKLKIVRCALNDTFLSDTVSAFPDTRRVLCVTRLSPEKGLVLLLEAAKHLKDQSVDFKLIMVGDGPLRGSIEGTINELQLTEHVVLLGWQNAEAVKEQLAQSCALVLPSFIEGLPVVIMEAMALRRPVISTWVAGIPELVTHRVNGWLVPPGNVGALAAAMKEALEAPIEQLEAMGRDGAQRVKEYHDARKEAAKLAELFRQSVSAAGNTPC